MIGRGLGMNEFSDSHFSSNNTFTIGYLGAISLQGTEGYAIQLWTYGFLAHLHPRTCRPVAGWFPYR